MDQAMDNVLTWVSQEAQLATSDPKQAVHVFWETFGPGGRLHPHAFLASRGHLVIEAFLLLGIIYLVVQGRSPPPDKDTLTEKEVDELCDSWQPESLVPTDSLSQVAVRTPIIEGLPGPRIVADGKEVVNLAAMNFWDLAGNADVQAANHAAIEKYGIGSCGPRGFYGTIDVHLDLEADITAFMGTEEAIIYSYDVSTMPSVLPAFASRKDIIVMDEASSWPLRNGADLSRAQVLHFKHNDMEDLERVLVKALREHTKRKKPLNRRFIVVEGIYMNGGDLAPLAELYAIKEKHKFRLIVDETLSFGVLGERGRGAWEHAGLRPGDVDIGVGSMSTGMASVGGFCVGTCAMVDHQRLSGSGYCFSASLPPVLAVTASETLALFKKQSTPILKGLHDAARLLRNELASMKKLVVYGSDSDVVSPVIHLRLAKASSDVAADLTKLVSVRDRVFDQDSIYIATHRPTNLDRGSVVPALKCLLCTSHTTSDIKRAASAIMRAADELL